MPELCSESRLPEQRVRCGTAPALQRHDVWRLLQRAGRVFAGDHGHHVRCLWGVVRELRDDEREVQ